MAAASYEARAYGVRSAMPSVTAMRMCAELMFVPPRFEVYRAVSRQVRAIWGLVRTLFPPEKGIRLIGVTVSNLGGASGPPAGQLPLFVADESTVHVAGSPPPGASA